MDEQAYAAPASQEDATEATSGQRPAPLANQQQPCRETVDVPSIVRPI
jgi:hypothetical protein